MRGIFALMGAAALVATAASATPPADNLDAIRARVAEVFTAATQPNDTDGCKDASLKRLKGFYLNDCDKGDNDHFVFADGTRAAKDVSGMKVRLAYAITDGVQVPSPTSVLRDYVDLLKLDGWTIIASGDERWVTARRGDEWAEIATNGGGNYQIVYINPAVH